MRCDAQEKDVQGPCAQEEMEVVDDIVDDTVVDIRDFGGVESVRLDIIESQHQVILRESQALQ
jgi:hypothetical protein